jgi:hypothetical protein
MVAHAAAVQQPVAVALEHRACLSGGVRGGGGGGGGVSAVSVLKGVHIHDLSHFHNHYTPFEARPFLFVRFFCIDVNFTPARQKLEGLLGCLCSVSLWFRIIGAFLDACE